MTIPWKPHDMPTLTPALPGGKKLIEFVALPVRATGIVTQKDGRRLINVNAIVLDR